MKVSTTSNNSYFEMTFSELSENEMCHLSDTIRQLIDDGKLKESKENE